MSTILNTIADYAKERVETAKKQMPFNEIKEIATALPKGDFPFLKSLKKEEMSFICEIKKASPSKGVIDPVFDYIKIAKEYNESGADCISCLTEPKWFLGSDEIFKNVRSISKIPMLRKDFTVDEYQIYEAKCMGADCVLLICALLDTKTIERYLEICDTLGLNALVETHTEDEIKSAVSAGAEIIGVNSRNLKNFSVNLQTAKALRDAVPPNKIFVAESGIMSSDDVKAFSRIGTDAVLMGELLMRAENKKSLLSELREAARG